MAYGSGRLSLATMKTREENLIYYPYWDSGTSSDESVNQGLDGVTVY